MIAGEEWLLTLASQGEQHRRVASRILRTQILTVNRSGHVLFLGWAPYRDQIAAAAHWGKLAGLIVECADCHCQALLGDWERAALLSSAERRVLFQTRRRSLPRSSCMFLAKCVGAEISVYAAHAVGLPSREEGE